MVRLLYSMKKLSQIGDNIKLGLEFGLIFGALVVLGAGNGVVQQTKHLGYHLTGFNHRRVSDKSYSFDYYQRIKGH